MADVAVNNDIIFSEVLVIGADGKQLGKMTPEEGIQIAKEIKMDLVCVSPNASIPVCKIINYGMGNSKIIPNLLSCKEKSENNRNFGSSI